MFWGGGLTLSCDTRFGGSMGTTLIGDHPSKRWLLGNRELWYEEFLERLPDGCLENGNPGGSPWEGIGDASGLAWLPLDEFIDG